MDQLGHRRNRERQFKGGDAAVSEIADELSERLAALRLGDGDEAIGANVINDLGLGHRGHAEGRSDVGQCWDWGKARRFATEDGGRRTGRQPDGFDAKARRRKRGALGTGAGSRPFIGGPGGVHECSNSKECRE